MNRTALFVLATAVAGAPFAAAAQTPPEAGPPALAAAPPAEEPGPFTVSRDVDTSIHRDRGYRLFSDEGATAAVGVSALRELARAGVFSLAAGVGWLAESASQRGLAFDATLRVNTFQAHLVAALALHRSVVPYLRLSGGASYGEVELALDDGPAVDDDDWSGGARAGLGLRAQTQARKLRALPDAAPPIAVSVAVEGGFGWATPFRFAVRPAADEAARVTGEAPLPTAAVPLGALDRAQGYFRVGIGLHF